MGAVRSSITVWYRVRKEGKRSVRVRKERKWEKEGIGKEEGSGRTNRGKGAEAGGEKRGRKKEKEGGGEVRGL